MLRRIMSEVKQYKLPSILTPICMIFEVIFEMLIPICIGKIVDVGVANGDINFIIKIGLLMILFAICGLLAGIGGAVFGANAATGFAKNLRKAMYDNIQTFSFSNIDKFSTAGLITRLTTDVTNIQNAYQMILRMFFRAPFSLIIAMVCSFMISPQVAFVYLVAVIFLAIILGTLLMITMKYFEQVFKKYDELNASVQENTSAIRVVKAYVREEYERNKFIKAATNVYKLFVKAESNVILAFPIMNFTIYACILLISWVGAHLIMSGSLQTGQLMTLLTYCMSILMSLMMLSMIFVMITMSMASAERIGEVLNEKADIVNPENPVYEIKDGSVSFDKVSFSYFSGNGEPVLNDITFSVKEGETIGIIGGTGSAKSSLVNLISRLYDVKSGEVKVGGVNVKDYDIESLRNGVSVVLQKNVLFSGTILENLRWGNKDASLEDCIKACKLASADEFITQFPDGYDTYIEQGGTNVSGGQKQRLCIARALLKNPKILILDDSTSAVDTATDAKIRKAFREDIPNTTKFIIAQRISSVQDADRIIVMEDGKINGIGTHEELLLNNEIYKDVYESQTGANADFDEVGGEG